MSHASSGIALAFFACLAPLPGQEPEMVSKAEVLARVDAGGWFETPRWRRADDGQLLVHYIADVGGAVDASDRFVPLLGDDFERGLLYSGAFGLATLLCHGSGDLVSMTDAELHFAALGIDASDIALRQLLLAPIPTAAPARRAAVLDRMLAIDVLVRRGCRQVEAELRGLLRGTADPALAEPARRALAALGAVEQAPPRARLDPETLCLPAGFDAVVVVEHGRLPDLGWLTALGRRKAAMSIAATLRNFGRPTLTQAMTNGCQVACDVIGELPFGLALAYGNARVDHSIAVVAKTGAGESLPFGLVWQAAGEFEHYRWQQASAPAQLRENQPVFAGTLHVEASSLVATVGGLQPGAPRPDLAAELLRDDDAAIRIVLPAGSRFWSTLADAELAAKAEGATLRILFGDTVSITLVVATKDEAAAGAWVDNGRERLAAAIAQLETVLPDAVREQRDAARLLGELRQAELTTDGRAASARATLTGVTPAAVRAIAEAWFAR